MLLERKSVSGRNKAYAFSGVTQRLYEERSVAAALHQSRSINANGLCNWPLHHCKQKH